MTTLDPRTQRVIRDLAKSQHDLQRQVDRLNRGQDAGHITIHNGRSIQLTDAENKVVRRIDADGDTPVAGPPPPKPAAPAVVPGQSNATLVVATDGDDEHGTTAPGNVVKVRIYATTQPPLAANPAHAKGVIAEVDGETTIGVHAGIWHVGIVWVDDAGQTSELSEVVTVEVDAPIDISDVIEEAQTRIDIAREIFVNDENVHMQEEEPSPPATLQDRGVWVRPSTGERFVYNHDTATWEPVTAQGLYEEIIAKQATILSAAIEHLTVTERATFSTAFANEFFANQAFIDIMAASQAYFGSQDANYQVTVDGQGLRVTVPNLDDPDGPRQTIIHIGAGGENTFATYDPATGEMLAYISADGAGSFQMLDTATDPAIFGRRLVGGLSEHPPSQYSQAIMDSIGWGEVAHVEDGSQPQTNTAGEVGYLQVNFTAMPGRQYVIEADGGHIIRNGETIRMRLRYTDNGLDPDIGSTLLHDVGLGGPINTWSNLKTSARLAGPSDVSKDPVEIRMLMSFSSNANWNFVGGSGWRMLRLRVIDIGPLRPASGYARNVRSTTGGTPPGVTQYRSVWWPSSFANYYRDGSSRRTGGTADRYLMQGRDPQNTHLGLQGSMIWFNQPAHQGEVGSTLPAAMAGADLDSGSLDVYGEYQPGHLSVRARVYWAEHTSIPGNLNISQMHLIGEFHVPRGGRGRIQLPQACLDAIKNGTFGCFAFYAADTSPRYAHGMSWQYKPNLVLNYQR